MSFMQNAFLLSAISVAICIWIAYKIYLKITFNLEKKGQKLLAQLSAISIAVGIGWTSNEILGGYFLELPIRKEFIFWKLITSLFLVSIFWGIIWLRGGWRESKNSLNNVFPTPSTEKNSGVISERIYADALNEFESTERKKGLYAKLLVENNGEETKVKAQYIKKRTEELESEENTKKNAIEKIHAYKQTAKYYLKEKKYILGSVSGVECLVLQNGMGAIVTKARDYRIYNNEETMAKSALNFRNSGVYLEDGYVESYERNEIID